MPRAQAVPPWLLLVLGAAVAGLVWIRARVGEPRPLTPPPVVAPARSVEPPPFPETPPEERFSPPETAAGPDSSPLPAEGTRESGPPRIALVLDDVGYRLEPLEQACALLPKEVTFAVIPHLPDSTVSAEYLHVRGFPVILHAPMQPLPGSRVHPGPGALLVGMPTSEVATLLERGLSLVPHAEGVNNHMGSRATADPVLMGEVMAFLRVRGLYFLDSRTTAATVAYRAAREAGVPAAQKSLFLDDVDSPELIAKYFGLLVERAGRDGEAVGIGHLRPSTVSVLSREIPAWRKRGVSFVPLRELVR